MKFRYLMESSHNILKNQRGFSLAEIGIALLLLSLLILIVSNPFSSGAISTSQEQTVEGDFFSMRNALQSYSIDYSGFPDAQRVINGSSTIAELSTELNHYMDFSLEPHTTNAHFVVLRTATRTDPWNEPYYLYFPANNNDPILVASFGPDRTRANYSSGNFGDDLVMIIENKR